MKYFSLSIVFWLQAENTLHLVSIITCESFSRFLNTLNML